MSEKRYAVALTENERATLKALVKREILAARKRTRAQVLLKVDATSRNDEQVRVNWRFTIDRAREKLRDVYPQI